MTNEETKERQAEKEAEPTAPLSIVDEAKKVRDEIKAENDRREQILKDEQALKANDMLGSTAGGHVAPTLAPEISNIEYANKLKRGEVNPLAEDGISIN